MASRSLGTLTWDLIAKIGGFEQGLDKAGRKADDTSKRMRKASKEIEDAWSNAGRLIAAGFAGITIGSVFTKFIQESRDAEQEQAQLAAAIRSTGAAAGYSQKQLNDMASSFAQNSVFSEGEINKAQTRLLSYTGVVGEKYPEALQAALDMSARLGMSLEQSAETVGKALDVPSQGMAALSKQGFRFTEEQKKLVEQLERTGKTAQAQAIVLDALKSSYGGAAAAARDTLGGALTALQNNINDLLTGDSGSIGKMRSGIEELNSTLTSDETRQAFQTFTGWLAGISSTAIKAAGDVGKFLNSDAKVEILGNYALSEFGVGGRKKGDDFAASNIRAIKNDIETVQKAVQSAMARGDARALARWEGEVKKKVASLEYFTAMQKRDAMPFVDPRLLGNPGSISDQVAAWGPKRGGGSASGGGGSVGGTKASTAGKDPYAEARRYLESLQKQLEKTQELTEMEQALRDLQMGRLGQVTPALQEEILGTARQIDAARVLAEENKKRAEATEEARRAQEALLSEGKQLYESTRTPLERFNEQQDRLNVLLEAGAIDFVTAARAGEQYKKALEDAKTPLKEMDEFTKNAAENIQRSLGDGLVDILEGNFDDIGKNFAKMLTRMAADALAADIARKMFGSAVKGGEGSGWFGEVLGAIGNVLNFGGPKASGGPVMPNTLYRVNELGPEMFQAANGNQFLMTGSEGGNIVPNHALGGAGGGTTIVNNYTVGDIPTMSKVKEFVAATQAQSAGRLSRSRTYGGAFS